MVFNKFFWVFQTKLNGLYQIIVHLNTLTHPLRELIQKPILIGLESVTKLLENSNSVWTVIPSSAILVNLYIECSLHQRHPILCISTMILQKIDKGDHQTASYSLRPSSPTDQWYSKPKGKFSA